MIESRTSISESQVAHHYNELDELYRKVWGEHVHHGWFLNDGDSKDAATLRLSDEVAKLLEIKPGNSVCDIGCGYGATSKFLHENYQATVLGLSISSVQLEIAQKSEGSDGLKFRLLNWLENDLPDQSFDHLISIESSEHMPDKSKFFSEARRVLKENGTFVICAWLTRESPQPLETRFLLEPICREGRLPSMGSESEYRQFFTQHGFEVRSFSDISHLVKRTWTLSLYGLLQHLKSNPRDIKLLFSRFNSNAEFLKTLFRIRLAYETGAMRYGVFKAVKTS